MSTQNLTNPDINCVKPKNHPCKLRFQDIQSDWDNDYENLVNLVQRHTNCSTAYCLCKKRESDGLSCRFDFPKEICEKTHLEYQTFKTKAGKEHYKVKVVTKRWQANCDIQVVIDYHSCLEYIAKYLIVRRCHQLPKMPSLLFWLNVIM